MGVWSNIAARFRPAPEPEPAPPRVVLEFPPIPEPSSPLERGATGALIQWNAPGRPSNWFQLGEDARPGQAAMAVSAVYACVSVIAQELARIPVRHRRIRADGSRETLENTPAARLLKQPNGYMTWPNWMLYHMQTTLLQGNGVSRRQLDDRGAVIALHPRPWSAAAPLVGADGFVMYDLTQTRLDPRSGVVPGRMILHTRVFTHDDPLEGITPLEAASRSAMSLAQSAATKGQMQGNQAIPGGVLTTDQPLSAENAKRLAEQWDQGFGGGRRGKTAVLDRGAKFSPVQLSAAALELLGGMNWDVDDVARCFRVPLWMVNRLENATFSNAETMGRSFIMQTLGFWIEHLEADLGHALTRRPDEVIEFDVDKALTRADLATRVDSGVKAVQGGLLEPNEWRVDNDYPARPNGSRLYAQQQLQPLGSSPAAAPASSSSSEQDDDEPSDDQVERARLRLELGQREGELAQLRAEIAELREGVGDG